MTKHSQAGTRSRSSRPADGTAPSDLTDPQWAAIGPLLPPEAGRNCRPAHDNRRVLNGILWIADTGAPWRKLPKQYGKWNSVYRRFERWSLIGICDAVARMLTQFASANGKRRAAYGAGLSLRTRTTAFRKMVRQRKTATRRGTR